MISSPVLKFYDVDKEVAVQCELVVSASEQTYYRLDSRWRLRQELSLSFGKKICSNRKGVSSNSASMSDVQSVYTKKREGYCLNQPQAAVVNF